MISRVNILFNVLARLLLQEFAIPTRRACCLKVLHYELNFLRYDTTKMGGDFLDTLYFATQLSTVVFFHLSVNNLQLSVKTKRWSS